MTKAIRFGLMTLVAVQGIGCASKATDEQLEKMCEHLLEISGDMRGTVEAVEVKRIEEEYAVKEKNLKDEMARDLKGMDDALAVKKAAIESGNDEAKAPEAEEAEEKGKDTKAKKGEAKEEAPLSKEDKIKAVEESIAKQKKDITDQFERLIKVLGPQMKYAVRDAKKYVKKRQKKAKETQKKCVDDVKKRDISEEKFQCRIKTETRDDYFACK